MTFPKKGYSRDFDDEQRTTISHRPKSMPPESSDIEIEKNLSTRVNSARLQGYIGRHVRLACKVLKVRASSTLPVSETYHSLVPSPS